MSVKDIFEKYGYKWYAYESGIANPILSEGLYDLITNTLLKHYKVIYGKESDTYIGLILAIRKSIGYGGAMRVTSMVNKDVSEDPKGYASWSEYGDESWLTKVYNKVSKKYEQFKELPPFVFGELIRSNLFFNVPIVPRFRIDKDRNDIIKESLTNLLPNDVANFGITNTEGDGSFYSSFISNKIETPYDSGLFRIGLSYTVRVVVPAAYSILPIYKWSNFSSSSVAVTIESILISPTLALTTWIRSDESDIEPTIKDLWFLFNPRREPTLLEQEW